MKFSQSLILSVPIARPGDKVPAANARVDVYCEHGDRDGAAAAHMRLAEALRPVLARWLVDESKVVALGESVVANTSYCMFHGRLVSTPSWESETLRMADEQRMADESGIDGDDDEVGD